MIYLNLLPDLKKEYLRAQRMRNMVISGAIITSILAAGGVVLLAMIVYMFQQSIIDQQKSDIAVNHRRLSSQVEIDKYLTIQNQLSAIDGVSGNRAQYARLFDYLKQLNPAPPYNVSLYKVDIDEESTIMKIEGAAPNFETVNNFKNTLEEAILQDIVDGKNIDTKLFPEPITTEANYVSDNGTPMTIFNFEMKYSPEAFDNDKKDIKLYVPKMITSDGDQNAPKQMFSAPQREDNNGN